MSDSVEDLTELRLWSLEKIKENKAKVARAYNKKVRPKEFHVGDLVWEAVLPLGTKDAAYGKWSPNWHGPYRIDQDMDQPTCELSGEGLRRLKVFLAATFLVIVLVLVGTRGAADVEVPCFLEADCGVIGCFCIMTFFKGGEFLQKRTTGAGGRNSKGEPSLCVGSGPFCCCKEKKLG